MAHSMPDDRSAELAELRYHRKRLCERLESESNPYEQALIQNEIGAVDGLIRQARMDRRGNQS